MHPNEQVCVGMWVIDEAINMKWVNNLRVIYMNI